MDKLKQWVALTVLGCLAVMAAGWFLLVSPKRGEAQELRDQATAQESANGTLRTQLAMLKAQAKDLPAQKAKLAAVAAKIPDNPALPALIRALDRASADSGVELVSIAPSAPTPLVAPAAAAAVAAPAAAPAAGAAAAPAAVPVAAGAPAAAGAVSSIPLAINVVGGYFQVQQFLSSLEGLQRALRVTGLTLAPGGNPVAVGGSGGSTDDGRSLSATISSQVYMTAAGSATTATPVAPTPAAPAN